MVGQYFANHCQLISCHGNWEAPDCGGQGNQLATTKDLFSTPTGRPGWQPALLGPPTTVEAPCCSTIMFSPRLIQQVQRARVVCNPTGCSLLPGLYCNPGWQPGPLATRAVLTCPGSDRIGRHPIVATISFLGE